MPEELRTTNKPNHLMIVHIVNVVLIAVIVAMLLMWQPWNPPTDRTITVTGEATVMAEPDEYVFSPSYQFTNTNKDTALAELTKKQEEVVTKVKELGVNNNQIKTNSSGYDLYFREEGSDELTYTLSLTVTVGNRDLAQKIQDYLLTTAPTGSVSPQATFSDERRKELESQARDQATQDARSKVDQSAKNLGFSVGKVKEVSDGSGFGVFPADDRAVSPEDKAAQQLTIQPGQNELNYTVTVVYYLQ